MRFSFRRRLPWGILLALLAAVSIWAAVASIPYTYSMKGFDCSLDDTGEKITVEHAWYTSSTRDDQEWGWIQHFDVDLATGKIEPWSHEQSIRQMVLCSRPPVRKADEDSLKSFQYPTYLTAVLYVRGLSGGPGVALVADRYIVGQKSGKLRSVDLRDPLKTRREIDAPSEGGILEEIPGSRSFVYVQQAATVGTNVTQPPSIRLDLIKINDDGDFEFVANWSSVAGGRGCAAVGDQIASLNLSGTGIEFRAVDDGRLLDTLDLPESFDVTKHSCMFMWDLFVADLSPNNTMSIDLQTKQQLPPPPAGTYQLWPHFRSGSPLLNYFDWDGSRGVLIHRETGQQIMTYTSRTPTERPVVLDENRLLFPSHAYGFSAKIVEIPTGNHVRSLVPLWWVPWFVGLFAVAYLIAAIGWMRASAVEGGWAWLDVALIGGLALLPLAIRLHTGDTFDGYRSPHRFIHGICTAGLSLTVIWLVLGKSRLILRGLPLLLTLSFVVAVCYMVWGVRPVQVWHSITSILVPVGYGLLICLVAKWLRIEFACQLSVDTGTSDGNLEAPMARKVQLRDLFLVVASIAVLLATLRPLVPTIASISETQWLEPRPIKGICVMLLFGAAMLSTSRWIFFCASVLALVTTAALVTRDLSLFVGNDDRPWLWTYQFIPLGLTVSAGIASMVLFLLPYRLRGWRKGRRLM